jgi:hypothetical protein
MEPVESLVIAQAVRLVQQIALVHRGHDLAGGKEYQYKHKINCHPDTLSNTMIQG